MEFFLRNDGDTVERIDILSVDESGEATETRPGAAKRVSE